MHYAQDVRRCQDLIKSCKSLPGKIKYEENKSNGVKRRIFGGSFQYMDLPNTERGKNKKEQ